jgi:hypothetical protein
MKINVNNTTKLEEAINVEQKRARERTISVDIIKKVIKEVEAKLATMMYKKDWSGVTVCVDYHAQKFASSYSGIPQSTKFSLTRGNNGWFVTSISRSNCGVREIEFLIEHKGSEIANFLSNTIKSL